MLRSPAAKFLPLGVVLAMLCTTHVVAETPKFCGIEVTGKKIAFVCDGSRWMKNKVDDLSDQIVSLVNSLSPDQQVAIVFVADDRAYGPNDGKPMPATDENKAACRSWLRRVPLGRTNTPIAGFDRAFEGNPETVLFVSDSQFENRDDVAARVASLNHSRAAHVHAIPFFRSDKEDQSRSFYQFMKRLAEDNHGELKVIYADELKRTRK